MNKYLFILGLLLSTVGLCAEKSIYDRMLNKAVKSGDLNEAKTLVKKGADLNLIKTKDFVMLSPDWLTFFTENGYVLDRENDCILRTLFWENRRAYVNQKSWSSKGSSILDKLKVLLDAGANPNCENHENEPLLIEISGEYSKNSVVIKSYKLKPYIAAFKLIYKNTQEQLNQWFYENKENYRGRHWNSKKLNVRRKAIYLPIINNNKDLFRFIIEQGFEINSVSYEESGVSKMTPLEGALYMKDIEMVQLVIEKGADINLEFYSERHKENITPIDFAHDWVLDEIELYLLERGAKYKLFNELNQL